jgi:hypothetical protein
VAEIDLSAHRSAAWTEPVSSSTPVAISTDTGRPAPFVFVPSSRTSSIDALGRSMIVAVLGAVTQESRFDDAATLLDWAFSQPADCPASESEHADGP